MVGVASGVIWDGCRPSNAASRTRSLGTVSARQAGPGRAPLSPVVQRDWPPFKESWKEELLQEDSENRPACHKSGAPDSPFLVGSEQLDLELAKARGHAATLEPRDRVEVRRDLGHEHNEGTTSSSVSPMGPAKKEAFGPLAKYSSHAPESTTFMRDRAHEEPSCRSP